MTEISPEDLRELLGEKSAALIERAAEATGCTRLMCLRSAVVVALKYHSDGAEGPKSGMVKLNVSGAEDDTHLMLADDYAAEVAEEPAEFIVGPESEPPSSE